MLALYARKDRIAKAKRCLSRLLEWLILIVKFTSYSKTIMIITRMSNDDYIFIFIIAIFNSATSKYKSINF